MVTSPAILCLVASLLPVAPAHLWAWMYSLPQHPPHEAASPGDNLEEVTPVQPGHPLRPRTLLRRALRAVPARAPRGTVLPPGHPLRPRAALHVREVPTAGARWAGGSPVPAGRGLRRGRLLRAAARRAGVPAAAGAGPELPRAPRGSGLQHQPGLPVPGRAGLPGHCARAREGVRVLAGEERVEVPAAL
ncbi:unnamed protein product, partial [Bubo scandiacus]